MSKLFIYNLTNIFWLPSWSQSKYKGYGFCNHKKKYNFITNSPVHQLDTPFQETTQSLFIQIMTFNKK